MKTDAELRQHVIDELYSEPALDANTISVTVKDGLVHLSGRVSALPRRAIAERAAQRVAGVRGVTQELTIALSYESFRTDFEIAEETSNALKWCALIPHDSVHAAVDHAKVTLTGCVEHVYQKRAAEELVRNMMGVRAVIDFVTVSSSVAPASIEDEVQRNLHRTIDHDVDNLHAAFTQGVVTLTGQVSSWSEREEAERAAMKLHGVSDVDNQITVCA